MTGLVKLNAHQKAYICVHVFEKTKPVLLVSREDGDWCFLCGDEHPNHHSSYRVAGIGHIVEDDITLESILDLQPNEEAERSGLGAPWIRTGLSKAPQ